MPILEQKIASIRDTGVEIAACTCSGCMIQIQGGLDKQLPCVRMKHVADILAEKIKSGQWQEASQRPALLDQTEQYTLNRN